MSPRPQKLLHEMEKMELLLPSARMCSPDPLPEEQTQEGGGGGVDSASVTSKASVELTNHCLAALCFMEDPAALVEATQAEAAARSYMQDAPRELVFSTRTLSGNLDPIEEIVLLEDEDSEADEYEFTKPTSKQSLNNASSNLRKGKLTSACGRLATLFRWTLIVVVVLAGIFSVPPQSEYVELWWNKLLPLVLPLVPPEWQPKRNEQPPQRLHFRRNGRMLVVDHHYHSHLESQPPVTHHLYSHHHHQVAPTVPTKEKKRS